MTKFKTISAKVYNLPRVVCNHLIDNNRPFHHRMMIGAALMAFGVLVTTLGESIALAHYIAGGIGSIFHGIGLLPILERMEKFAKTE